MYVEMDPWRIGREERQGGYEEVREMYELSASEGVQAIVAAADERIAALEATNDALMLSGQMWQGIYEASLATMKTALEQAEAENGNIREADREADRVLSAWVSRAEQAEAALAEVGLRSP